MADWRQIQARIRKARTGPNAIPKMTELYARTRDAMVAFELGKLYEQEQQKENAIEWYSVAVERFRRSNWKQRGIEAITRLGGTPPVTEEAGAETASEPATLAAEESPSPAESAAAEEIEASGGATESAGAAEAGAEGGTERRKRTRRGRRGGRRRRKAEGPAPLPERAFAEPPEATPESGAIAEEPSRERERVATRRTETREEGAPAAETVGSERAARGLISRTGDPGMASRLARLDSQLRRLIAAPAHTLAEIEQAPAGPGVFLLSDADLATPYYVERCDTLRVGLKIMVQGARGRDRNQTIRAALAKHLDISEAQAKKYMQEHCVVRWIQLDEGASHLAHFAIAVLRPVLNE